MRSRRPVVRGLLARVHCYLLSFLAFAMAAYAQGSSAHLEYIKYIPIAGKDPASSIETIPELGWSPLSLAWSPDGKRIAFAAASMRPFGVVDVETKRVTPITTSFRGEGRVHWSKNMNWLVIDQKRAFSVYDMSAEVPQLRYSVEFKFPKLLDAVGSDIVTVKGEDYLVLAGDTKLQADKTNPHIVAYHLRTGERRWSYQIRLDPFEPDVYPHNGGFSPLRVASATDDNGDILVSVYASKKLTQKRITPAGTDLEWEEGIWIFNLTQQKVQCHINLYDKPEIQKNEFDDPMGFYHSLLVHPSKHWLVASHTQFNHVYSTTDCSLLKRLEPELKEGLDHSPRAFHQFPFQKPGVSDLTLSPSGQYLFGSSYWAPKPSNAPFRLWKTDGWKQIVDQTYMDDGAVTTAVFSQDEQWFAFGTSNRITIYRVH